MNTRTVLNTSIFALVMLSTLCLQAQTRSTVDQQADATKKSETQTALGDGLFGDQTNLADGSTQFLQTDIALRTTSGLAVQIRRSLSTRVPDFNRNIGIELQAFGNWSLDIPVMRGTYDARTGWISGKPNPQERCSTFGGPPSVRSAFPDWSTRYDEYWNGISISIPGKGQEQLLALPANRPRPHDGQAYYGTTQSEWRVRCLPSIKNGSGEGYVVVTTDGTKYYFDWMASRAAASIEDTVCSVKWGCRTAVVVNRREYSLYATRVEDRFGNYVSFSFNPASPHQLKSIVSSEGPSLRVAHLADGRISSVSANGRTWNYSYLGNDLATVTNPDASRWSFGGSFAAQLIGNQNKRLWQDCSPDNTAAIANDENRDKGTVISMTHPSGARGEFKFRNLVHGVTNIPGGCTDPSADKVGDEAVINPKAYWVLSLYDKAITGPGMQGRLWKFRYEPTWSFSSECGADCSVGVSRTRVMGPDGATSIHTFGNDYASNAGLLLETRIEKGGQVLKVVKKEYRTLGKIGIDPVRLSNKVVTEDVRQEVSSEIIQDSTTFKTEVETCGDRRCFDLFWRPQIEKSFSSLGFAKTDSADYTDLLDTWVLGLTARRLNLDTGIVTSESHYDRRGLETSRYLLGKLSNTFSYNQDGTLATVADGAGNTTTITGWKAGIPLEVRFPPTLEAPAGSKKVAAVNDDGLVVAITDEAGRVTGFGYDSIGSLSSVVYPREGSQSYNPMKMEFRPLTDADWKPPGIVSGQWRRFEGVGNRASMVYYDALHRPVLSHKYDTTDVEGTLQSSSISYDAGGRVEFVSYPSSKIIPDMLGTRNSYDALGRLTVVRQDSELGQLILKHEYVAGLGVQTTAPGAKRTLARFMAWGTPSYEMPIRFELPEGKLVRLTRDAIFGRTLSVLQGDMAGHLQQGRYFVYNRHGELCKQIEPETGATAMGYDQARNLAWSASGLDKAAFASTSSCDEALARSSGRRVDRAYDSRGRLTSIAFPDGMGDQNYAFDEIGRIASITTYNDRGRQSPVVNSFIYNNRGLMTEEAVSQPGWYRWAVGYSYDANANLQSKLMPSGVQLDFAPNALGQSTKVGSYASDVSYFPNGAIRSFQYGNGVSHTARQNLRQKIESLASSGILSLKYAYDESGNVVQVNDYLRGDQYARTMTYDTLDRLTTVKSCSLGGNCLAKYSYDSLDNLRSWNVGGLTDYAQYVYDSGNRLVNIKNAAGESVVGIDYDAQGNVSNKNGQTFSFDYGNRLRSVAGKEGHFRYDGFGRRVLTHDLQKAINVMSQYDSSGGLIYQRDARSGKAITYLRLGGMVIATAEQPLSGGPFVIRYHHADALGSPVAISDKEGRVSERTDYEPFGSAVGKPNHDGLGFTGHMMDGTTGLTYMQQRYYDSSLGRFLSADPIGVSLSSGSNFNRYGYAANNPYRFIDPDGRLATDSAIDSGSICTESYFKCRHSRFFDEGEVAEGEIQTGDSDSDGTWRGTVSNRQPDGVISNITIVTTREKEPAKSRANPEWGSYTPLQADWYAKANTRKTLEIFVARPAVIGGGLGVKGVSGAIKTAKESSAVVNAGTLVSTGVQAERVIDELQQPIYVPTDEEILKMRAESTPSQEWKDMAAGALDLLLPVAKELHSMTKD